MPTLKGRSAIVTGSTSGIGLGIAQALAAQGSNVMLNGFGEAREIEALATTLAAQHGVRVSHSPADMARPEQVEAMVAHAVSLFGAVDILVNNAGIQYTAPVSDFDPERWDAVLAVNLSSNFHTIRAALTGMRQRNWGRILNVASVHGLVGSEQKAAYVAAKHGVIGLTKVVALETATTGVTCNAICPGWVMTPLVQKQIDDLSHRTGTSKRMARQSMLAAKQPSGEFVTPEQIGAIAVFLCGEAAAQIRGASISVDGGWTAQ